MNILKIKSLLSLSILFLTISSCSKDTVIKDNEEEVIEETFNYTSTAKYNLNVVYFTPRDVSIRVNSHRRISEILLQGQDFFKKNMKEYGFGEKTFNLLEDKDKKRVKITYLKARLNTHHYPYSGGAGKVIDEINDYFLVNPNEKSSDHILVIMPVKDVNAPNVPFYGIGRWGFALDYDDMDIKLLQTDFNATKYIGGLLHELGHGLNLPHNGQKVSEIQSTEKGTALMGAGNSTYGRAPTFLTKASCAILNNNQIFNNTEDAFYGGSSAQIENVQGSFSNGELTMSGSVVTDVPVNNIGFYNDPADDNASYDAVTWAAPVNNDGTFSITMPIINELTKKRNTSYVLRLRLCHVNGDVSIIEYTYKFVNDIPILNF